MDQPTFFDEGLLDDEEREENRKSADKIKSSRRATKNPKCMAKKAQEKQNVSKDEFEEPRPVLGNGCKYLRDNKLGLYCRMGTRKVRRSGQGKIFCLDCDEPGKIPAKISKAEHKKLAAKERNG